MAGRVLISTERLDLCAPHPADVGPLAALWCDPVAMRYIGAGGPWTEAQVRERVERAIDTQGRTGCAFWTVRLRQPNGALGLVIGQCGVVPIEFDGPETELGYRFGRAHWGKGYASEGARAAAAYALRPRDESQPDSGLGLGLTRLVAVTYADNMASRRVLAKVGFRELRETDKYYSVRCLLHELTRDDLNVRTNGSVP